MRRSRASPSLLLGTYGPFLLKRSLRLRHEQMLSHAHIQGVSGSGKSRFLCWYYLRLLEQAYPATLIDPHGDLAHLVLDHLIARGFYQKPDAFERLLFLDLPTAERQGLYLPFNLLTQDEQPHTVAANVTEAMHRAFPELAEGAATFDTLLPRAVRVLVSHHLPITALERFFLDEAFRTELLADFADPDIAAFFQHAYQEMRRSDQITYAGSVLRRAALLTDLPILKHSFGQAGSALLFRQLMDAGRSAIINLALREGEAARLLGSLITVGFEQAAISRADMADHQRSYTHHLVIDEFSEFTSKSEQAVSRMLSATRKYGLFIVMAHQTWSQTPPGLKGALQNVGLEVAFRLGRADAEHSARILGRVDPKTIRQDGEDSQRHEAESRGMQDQWEEWVQHLQELPPRHAVIRRPFHRPGWLARLARRETGLEAVSVRTPVVPDVRVDARLRDQITAEYLRRYFQPAPPLTRDPAPFPQAPTSRLAEPMPATIPLRRAPVRGSVHPFYATSQQRGERTHARKAA